MDNDEFEKLTVFERGYALNYSWITYNIRRTDIIVKLFADDKSNKGELMNLTFDQSRIEKKAREGFVSKIPGKSKNSWVSN